MSLFRIFLTKAYRFTRDEMAAYIMAIPPIQPSTFWTPQGVTMHNTAQPNLTEWFGYTDAQREAWGDNYNYYCKATQHWHSAPHFCATPSGWSFVLCNPTQDGVHDSCKNHINFGVETVGDYEVGADDPASPGGQAAIGDAVNIIAALNRRFNFNPDALDFHRTCIRDAHPCPGSRIKGPDIIAAVKTRMAELAAAPKMALPIPPLPDWPALDSPFGQAYFTRMAHLYNCLIKAGFHNPAAVGIIANADMESAIEPTAVGDDGNAFNIFQWWWNPRGMAILQGCGVDVRTETRMDQIVAALTWELAYPYASTYAAINAATTGADAAGKFCDMFEGASAPGAHQRRQDDALRIEAFLADNMTWVLAQGTGD